MSEEWGNAQHMTKPVQSVSNKTTFILSAYKLFRHQEKHSSRKICRKASLRYMQYMKTNHQNILHSDIEASKGSELTKVHNINSLTEERVLSEYADVFRGLGKTGGKLHLEVDDKVTPVVIPPQGVPVAIKVRLKEELDHLESLEVTRRDDEPTEWVSSMVGSDSETKWKS